MNESQGRASRADILRALVLAIAAAMTTWCGFQTALWSGEQATEIARSDATQRRALHQRLEGNQRLAIDIYAFYAYLDARTTHRDELANFVYERFPPELRSAVDAWLKTDPLHNSSAPRSPFVLPQYSVPEWERGDALDSQGTQQMLGGLRANANSDNYALATMLFAAVSLFMGAGPHLRPMRLQWTFLLAGAALLLATTAWVCTRPVTFRQTPPETAGSVIAPLHSASQHE